jgi:stress-induced morphogen
MRVFAFDSLKYDLQHVEIENFSWKHNDDDKNAETHLDVTVVSQKFEGMKKETVNHYKNNNHIRNIISNKLEI